MYERTRVHFSIELEREEQSNSGSIHATKSRKALISHNCHSVVSRMTIPGGGGSNALAVHSSYTRII